MSLFSSNDEHFCTPFALHNQTNTRRDQIEISRLEPENEYGNVEYKLRLTDPTPERVERLVTQLKWRIREGQGEAILFLGVKDNGHFVGLTPDEIRLSLQTLERMSSKIGATMTIVKERIVDPESIQESEVEQMTKAKGKVTRNKAVCERQSKENATQLAKSVTNNQDLSASGGTAKKISIGKGSRRGLVRKVIQVLVKRKTHDISEELRVAVLGPTESGKSSLLGVLSHGEYDNGRGSARLNLFRHRHEVRSGHTSSISQEIFGFNSHGQPLTYNNCLTTEEIIESSSRIVTLIDLAGHQRYLSTTLFGLGSHSPDLVLIVISAISSITNITTDHISLALGMEKSLAIVINKVDLASKDLQDACYDELVRALQMIHPEITPQMIITLNDAMVAGARLDDSNHLPIFFTSCVTGFGLQALYAFFNEISTRINPDDLNNAVSKTSELQVDETFEVPGIGTVVSGLMIEGIIREGDEMLLGPDDAGNFSNVSIVSLQRHKIPCNLARAGQKCTMAIVADKIKVRKGMVMKEMDHEWRQNFSVCIRFSARIRFINGKRPKLSRGCPVSIYVGNVKQTCSVASYEIDSIDETLQVQLKLTKRPEYIRDGSRIILRHAMTKAIGTVTYVEKLFDN
uniref:GTP-binding protein 2 n=1 Tax=Aceria tosichella TaxID=561515 RepID=A0A6G1SHF0_9ACAR